MDNFTIYRDNKYDFKANISMKLEEVAATVTTKLIAFDSYIMKNAGKH